MMFLGGDGRLGGGGPAWREFVSRGIPLKVCLLFLSASLLLSHYDVNNFAPLHTLTIVTFCLTTGPWQWSKLTMD